MAGVNDAEERLNEIVQLTRLYDVYGALLSDHSKNIFESYVLDNYSLAEIAEEMGISRQGVRDIVVRYSKKLYDYESKLKFLEKLDQAADELNKLEKSIECPKEDTKAHIDRLRSILMD